MEIPKLLKLAKNTHVSNAFFKLAFGANSMKIFCYFYQKVFQYFMVKEKFFIFKCGRWKCKCGKKDLKMFLGLKVNFFNFIKYSFGQFRHISANVSKLA